VEIKELLAGLQEHKNASEVKEFIAQSITVDHVKSFLNSPDGEKIINSGTVSAVESRVTNALKKQQEKSSADLEAERKGKLTLEEQVQALTKSFEDAKRSNEIAEKKARILKAAADKNVPQDFINVLDLNKPDEEINAFIDAEAKRQDALIKKGVDDARGSSAKPGSGTAPPAGTPDLTKMSSQQRQDYYIKQREERLVKTS
jgi:flagellar capping protein FliD